jgi:EAL domain-containing protein (putative c-di-GMP-specific phosphodiesterase class I)
MRNETDLELIHCTTGTELFREGEAGECAYLLKSGSVEISTGTGADRRVLGQVGEGELIGEMSIMDAAPRSATATVVADSELCVIRRDQFLERLARLDPAMRYVIGLMSERYRHNLDSVLDLHRTAAACGEPALHREAVEKLELESELWAALERGELRVHYQPIVTMAEGKPAGFEALIRWQHPKHGMVLPERFIHLAEETPLIADIGTLALAQVVRDLPVIARTAPAGFFVGVNVSPRQLRGKFDFDPVVAGIAVAGLDPQTVKLELTESQLADAESVLEWARQAKSKGFRLAIDDFGTGYSSLSQLLRLQADTLKIDRSFVRDMLESKQAENMVTALVAIARSFDMDIVAEGIETEEQRAFLATLGCDYAQGYLFGRALTLEELPGWFRTR